MDVGWLLFKRVYDKIQEKASAFFGGWWVFMGGLMCVLAASVWLSVCAGEMIQEASGLGG